MRAILLWYITQNYQVAVTFLMFFIVMKNHRNNSFTLHTASSTHNERNNTFDQSPNRPSQAVGH